MVKKHSLKIRVSLKRFFGIGFTTLLGTSSLGFSGTYATENDPYFDTMFNQIFGASYKTLEELNKEHAKDKAVEELNKKYAKNTGPKLADVVNLSNDGNFCKHFLQPYALKYGLNVSEFSLKEKEEYFKATMEFNFAKLSKLWPKFLGGIEKNPTEILMNVMCEGRDFEVLDFIEKNYDEIKKKLPSDWIGLVKKLYRLNEEQVAAIRECISKKVIRLESIYGAKMHLEDLLGDRNMVFQYFMLCSSKNGGNLSLEIAKNKMYDKEFFESRIKRILDIYSIIFTDNAVNITKDMRKEVFLK